MGAGAAAYEARVGIEAACTTGRRARGRAPPPRSPWRSGPVPAPLLPHDKSSRSSMARDRDGSMDRDRGGGACQAQPRARWGEVEGNGPTRMRAGRGSLVARPGCASRLAGDWNHGDDDEIAGGELGGVGGSATPVDMSLMGSNTIHSPKAKLRWRNTETNFGCQFVSTITDDSLLIGCLDDGQRRGSLDLMKVAVEGDGPRLRTC
ncbi:hypothetical protein EJB05_44549, partial [Eragrostis curvula]